MNGTVHEYRYKIKGRWLAMMRTNDDGIVETVKFTGKFVRVGDFLVVPMPEHRRGIYQITDLKNATSPVVDLWEARVEFIPIDSDIDDVEGFQRYVKNLP